MGKLLIVFSIVCAGAMANMDMGVDTFESGWDRPGLDYHNYEMFNPREILCQWSCQKDTRCRAWTFVKPGIQGVRARCWLKHSIPRPVKSTCCTSGIIE